MQKNAELAELEFPVSKIKIHVPRFSIAAMALKLQRKHPTPDPPRQQVDYGNGHKVWEFNYSHPDFKEAQLQHAMFLEQKAQELVISRAVLSISLNREHREMLAAWKEANPDLFDPTDKDQQIFLEEICIQSDEDFEAFISHVTGIDPSEVATAEATNRFQGDVSGSSDNGVDDAAQRDQVRES